MRMFHIPQGTQVQVIKDGKEWYGCNFQEHVTKKDNLFALEEICIDPTGISPTIACVPGCVTIGSHWAKIGWYGFRRDGYAMLVPGHKVEVW